MGILKGTVSRDIGFYFSGRSKIESVLSAIPVMVCNVICRTLVCLNVCFKTASMNMKLQFIPSFLKRAGVSNS
jgi:hypothetical protein